MVDWVKLPKPDGGTMVMPINKGSDERNNKFRAWRDNNAPGSWWQGPKPGDSVNHRDDSETEREQHYARGGKVMNSKMSRKPGC